MTLQGKTCQNRRFSKERATLLLATNMDGFKKTVPFMIGKSKKPRCFSKVKSFPMEYTSIKNAWMTTKIFKDWLFNFDLKMKKQKSQILMFLDNCSVHKDVTLISIVEVLFLPPNTTSASTNTLPH